MEKRIGFIGAGQMAEALARGFIAKGICRAEHMFATDPVQERKEVFRSFKTNPVDGNIEVRAAAAAAAATFRCSCLQCGLPFLLLSFQLRPCWAKPLRQAQRVEAAAGRRPELA
jgi:hypothetical protein